MRYLLPLVFIVIFAMQVAAQEQPATLSLEIDTPSLQTGQTYDVNIRVANSPDLWLADVQISYDPNLVYVMGTRSGSPVQVGELFAGTGSVIARNTVQGASINFTVSKAGEVAPAVGNGIIGSFRIYPLVSGTTRLLFSSGDLRQLNAALDGTNPIAFTPVLLELTITGDTVAIPDEATATPEPTATATSAAAGEVSARATGVPTLVNVTAAPQTPEPITATETQSSPTIPLMSIGIALVVIALVGLGLLFRFGKRR
jgi:hypothetical protein